MTENEKCKAMPRPKTALEALELEWQILSDLERESESDVAMTCDDWRDMLAFLKNDIHERLIRGWLAWGKAPEWIVEEQPELAGMQGYNLYFYAFTDKKYALHWAWAQSAWEIGA